MSFLERPGAVEDTFDPLSPARLAFQIRRELSERPTSLPDAVVYDEVARRREELTAAATEPLEAYRERAGSLNAKVWRARLIESLGERIAGYAVLVVIGGVLGVLLPAGGTFGFHLWSTGDLPMSGVGPLGVALGVALALFITGRTIALVLGDSDGHVEEYRKLYSEVVQGRVAAAVEDLVVEVIAEEEARRRAPVLHPMAAPSLVELDSAAVIPAESYAEVRDLIDGHATSAIGIAGSRGAGKSTLLRLLCSRHRPDTRQISVFLPVPAGSTGGLARTIFAATVRTVIASRGVEVTRRRGRARRRAGDDIAWALEALDKITGSVSRQRSRRAGLSRWGVTAEAGGESTWTERELGAADWAEEFRGYVRGHRLRGGAPILVAIDELDKAADAERAIAVINELKHLFHIEGVHFVVSVSEDALHRFAARGVPVRDAFDTAFDAIVEVRPLTARESHELLRRRAPRFPLPAAMFCHAWSGGLPRDLVRTARACIAAQRRLGHPATVAELSAAVIRRDVTEVLDAAIRRAKDSGSTSGIEHLLTLRRGVTNENLPPHVALRGTGEASLPAEAGKGAGPPAPRTAGGADAGVPGVPSEDPLLASMEAYLEVAAAIGAYFADVSHTGAATPTATPSSDENTTDQRLPAQGFPEQRHREPRPPEQHLPEQRLPEQSLGEQHLPEQHLPKQRHREQRHREQGVQEQGLREQAALLAAAKAALGVHPSEARWRLTQAAAFTK